MRNGKTLFMWTISLIVILVMTACGGQSAPQDTTAPQAQPEPASTETTIPVPTEVPTDIPTEMPTEAPTTTVSFANDILPIIESRCINCHGGRKIEEGLVMRSYDEIMAGSNNGPVIVPGDVENSLLVELVTTKEMPKKGPKLTPPQIQLITDWVSQGALNN